jgi:hypothetical protein
VEGTVREDGQENLRKFEETKKKEKRQGKEERRERGEIIKREIRQELKWRKAPLEGKEEEDQKKEREKEKN